MSAVSLLALLLAAGGPSGRGGACLVVAVERSAGAWTVGPAYHLPGAPCPAMEGGGPLALRALGPGGAVLAEAAVAVAPVADGPAAGAGASARLWLSRRDLERLRALELREGQELLARRLPEGDGGPARVSAWRAAGRAVEVRWNRRAWPFALLRDPAGGQVLGAARGGRARLQAEPRRLELLLSDGVRGRRVLVRVR